MLPEMAEHEAQSPFDRLAAFRVVYLGILAYVVLAVGALQAAESLLQGHFQAAVEHASRVSPADGPVVPQIQARVRAAIDESPWTSIAGVHVNAIVLGADLRTPIYLVGIGPPPAPASEPSIYRQAQRLLPATVSVDVDVPVDSLLAGVIWVGLGAVLVPFLFVHQRRAARREAALYETALAARDATLERARTIQTELEKVQGRLTRLEPVEQAHVEEIATLERERADLERRLQQLAQRERSVRDKASRYGELDRERQALEDLLDEAVQDLAQKDSEITSLQERLQSAARAPASGGGRARGAEQLAKRMRTLYRNLEMDDRALQDMAALGDESLRLRAEESLKRLDDDPDQAAVRRKVGGLPSHLTIFELGFAGKGRIYYTRGRQRPFRILAVGGKASQKQDLEYLSRLS
jgi:hypothetical protein